MEDSTVCRGLVGASLVASSCISVMHEIFFFPASWPVACFCLFLFFQRMLLSFLFSYAFPIQMLTLFLLCVCVGKVVTADKAFRHSVLHLNHVDCAGRMCVTVMERLVNLIVLTEGKYVVCN